MPSLVNDGMFPLVYTFNCLDGYFAHTDPARVSIAETMQRRAGGGSIGAISPSGLGLTYDQQNFRKMLMEAIFHDGIREVGTALTVAKQRYAVVYGLNYLIYTQMLFGDPAMQLPWTEVALPQPPAVSIARSGNSVVLSWPAVTRDVYHQPTTVSGYLVWRGTSPYFDPNRPNRNCRRVASTSALTWTDTGAVGGITPIGDVGNNYFYVVQAANSAGHSAFSNRVASSTLRLRLSSRCSAETAPPRPSSPSAIARWGSAPSRMPTGSRPGPRNRRGHPPAHPRLSPLAIGDPRGVGRVGTQQKIGAEPVIGVTPSTRLCVFRIRNYTIIAFMTY